MRICNTLLVVLLIAISASCGSRDSKLELEVIEAEAQVQFLKTELARATVRRQALAASISALERATPPGKEPDAAAGDLQASKVLRDAATAEFYTAQATVEALERDVLFMQLHAAGMILELNGDHELFMKSVEAWARALAR